MYLPIVLTKKGPLTPSVEETRKQGFFGKAKSILRSQSRQLTNEEERIQGEKFTRRLQEESQVIGIQSFQGLTGGHIIQQKR